MSRALRCGGADGAVGGGSGQVIANGADVVFPGQGRFDVTLPAREGRNSIEAVLVGGEGPGTRPETLAFRLRGRPGEPATFAFDTTP